LDDLKTVDLEIELAKLAIKAIEAGNSEEAFILNMAYNTLGAYRRKDIEEKEPEIGAVRGKSEPNNRASANKKSFEHVDDFIAYSSLFTNSEEEPQAKYARWVLNYFRMPAIQKMDFEPFMRRWKLFCRCGGKLYRVTGASSLGDVWLTLDFQQNTGYQKRVSINDCYDWGGGPPY